MKKTDVVNILNNYAFDNNIQPVIETLNIIIAKNKNEYLDLIFMAIATTQLYGFLSYLTEEEQQLFFECDYFRSNSYRGIELPFYNRGQLSFLYELERKQKVFFSAPTSFGKTSIINEYILNNYSILNNIIFIVPTNSLLEELYQKFQYYNTKLHLEYNITCQPVVQKNKRNIMFLTPERFMLISENDIINKFDLIVMDETYKIVDANNKKISDFVNHRSLRFRKAADIIAKIDTKVVFLSPFTYILTDSMKNFLNKFNINKIDRKLEYVKRDIILVDSSQDITNYFGHKINGYQKTSKIADKVNFILNELKGQSSIVYVSTYSKAYDIVHLSSQNNIVNSDERYLAFLNHIKENYLIDGKETWSVYDGLKKGIGIYVSPLPRYIKKEIVNLFERKILNTLVVTSAFTEGVNTCAANLIFTSLINGPNSNKLSDIDVLNVSGRAGRFAKNTIGKIFCINKGIYNHIIQLQNNNNNIKLENHNYMKKDKLLDYEIEMMDKEYLTEEQNELIVHQDKKISSLNLTRSELNISLNVSNEWKIILYEHFLTLTQEQLYNINKHIESIYSQEEGEQVNSIQFIFKDLKTAFADHYEINLFPHEPYEIGPFDKSGNFTWGRFYKIYVSGSPKNIISNNIKFISSKLSQITKGTSIKNKCTDLDQLCKIKNSSWILKFFKNDLSLNMNTFYTETFKIVSNIIEYKIPFYLTFYVSIYKLFITKHPQYSIDNSCFDILKLINIFEDGYSENEYIKLIDCGLPPTTINKLSEKSINLERIKNQDYDDANLDSYEKIILNEIIEYI